MSSTFPPPLRDAATATVQDQEPFAVARLFGPTRFLARSKLSEMADQILSSDMAESKAEALGLMRRELACLEKESAGLKSLLRTGNDLRIGLTEKNLWLQPWVVKLLGGRFF